MKVAIGIPTYNRADLLDRLLSFLLPESDLLEFIYIVDNGKQDIPYQDHPKIKIQKNDTNLGCCGGWNQIIKKSIYDEDCDWVLILNDDIVLAPGQLKSIIDILALSNEKWILTPDWEWACIAISKAGAENMQYEPYKWFDGQFWPGYFGDNDFHWRIKISNNEDKIIQGIPELSPWIKDKSKTRELDPSLSHHKDTPLYINKWGGLPGNERYSMPYNKDDYWDKFYKLSGHQVPSEPSDFAKFTLKYMQEHEIATCLDVGCGTGRDTLYFQSEGIHTLGIDPNTQTESAYIVQGSWDDVQLPFKAYYMRFLVHALKEEQFDELLNYIKRSSDSEATLFIETRSIKGYNDTLELLPVTFTSPIGGEHFRLLYSLDYLKNKFKKLGWTVIFEQESKGLAQYKAEDPEIIRLIVKVLND